ncbi:MAG: SprT-like domain-containing protein [Gammaproteobacteria bacterium]|nr:SprT-like domain-containing protein [Gammaproteobacteria bacterium]MCY4314200.1 SprT-like domain-containing protein [Gammaproteobacteria bacterium]
MMMLSEQFREFCHSDERAVGEKILQSHDAQVFFDVGDQVLFARNIDEWFPGTIEKLNPKRCVVLAADGNRWTVPYIVLQHADESLLGERALRARRLADVAIRARQMMNEHGLKHWSLHFSHGERELGRCQFRDQAIFISRNHAIRHAHEFVDDTILHEIAHALAGHDAGHGPEWKKIALRVGAIPKSRAYEKNQAETAARHHLEAKGKFRSGDSVSFAFNGGQFAGDIVRMNPKRAKVDCGNRVFSVPYSLLEHHRHTRVLWKGIS